MSEVPLYGLAFNAFNWAGLTIHVESWGIATRGRAILYPATVDVSERLRSEQEIRHIRFEI